MKDLGVIMDHKGTFKQHITKVRNRCMQVSAWLLRTFENRSIKFLRFLFRTYISPHLDYCSQIWTPVQCQEIDSLEAVVRAWTRKCPAIRERHYWDRLELMGLSSVQRRHERYMAIYVWKIFEAEVSSNGGIEAQWTTHKGRKAVLPKLRGSQSVRTLRVNSFSF